MYIPKSALALLLLAAGTQSFAPMSARHTVALRTSPAATAFISQAPRYQPTKLFAETGATEAAPVRSAMSLEAERLKSMAAQLRAEAAALEAQQAQETAEATERAFKKFDTNQDGEISVEELKKGLEKMLKMELQDDRVAQLMEEFDASGDGALQLDEFVGVDRFTRRLDAIVRDEKQDAIDAKNRARLEQEAADLAKAKLELINDKPPSNTDKLVSILPYLLPLMDGLQFGRFLLEDQTNNPLVGALGALYFLYRSVPFSGFIAYLALNVLSGNLSLNRQVRFNMQQAIYLDIALFLPSLASGIFGLVAQGAGAQVPEIVSQVGNDAIFVALLASIGCSTISSLLGVTPDKIPFLSDQVNNRMPTVDMFDENGQYKDPRSNQDDEKK